MAAPAGLPAPVAPSAWAKGPPLSLRTSAPPAASSFFPPLKLAVRQPGSKEGCPAISFSAAEVQEGRHRLQHSLVAKFSGGRPKIEEVRRVFSEAWALEGAASIGAWDARHILIILKSEDDAKRVLAHSLRKVGQYIFRLFRWSPEFHARKESTVLTTWVRLPSLPPELFDLGYIRPIISVIGNFIAIDEKTRLLSNPCFARACVEIDVSKPILEKIWVGIGGQGFWQFLEFENNLFYCSRCKIHGHQISGCRRAKSAEAANRLQANPADKPISVQAALISSVPAKAAAASDFISPAQLLNPPPLEKVSSTEALLDKDKSLALNGWQEPKKKKLAKKASGQAKEYKAKACQVAPSVINAGSALEVVLPPIVSISAQNELEMGECASPQSLIANLESGLLIEVEGCESQNEALPTSSAVSSRPQEAPISSPSIPFIEPSSLTMVAVVRQDASEIDPRLPSIDPSVSVIPPIKGLDDPTMDIENSKVSDASVNSAGISLEQPAAKAAAHAKSESSDSSGPNPMSSAQRKLKFQAERKAEKAARKAERKAKNKRDAAFVFKE